ncbi:hypothetical protein DAEQUDRAFT_731784 [Daedalea quercina L-15889]|uniref:MYND-type domain-containing protein n=1 Tax=Daedalea quercina L-15889 TaxID=1314783 RepID=A0A165M2I0_9APHY|nr:hypothetical protein DAEQUDRAFT_731784 [Daedalea quercina L-15889]
MARPYLPFKATACRFSNPGEQELVGQAMRDATQAQRLALMGQYAEAENLHLQALAVKERILGCSEVSTAISYNAMGDMYTRMGRLEEAKTYLQKALHIREGNTKCDELDAAVTRMYLGKVLEMQGDLTGAKNMRRLGWPKKMLCGNEECPQGDMFRPNFSLCSRCKSIYYCGKACQKHDWQRHKEHCKHQ